MIRFGWVLDRRRLAEMDDSEYGVGHRRPKQVGVGARSTTPHRILGGEGASSGGFVAAGCWGGATLNLGFVAAVLVLKMGLGLGFVAAGAAKELVVVVLWQLGAGAAGFW
ncbi:hypothetical protein FCV25MIE_08341 [Fagus crenata]